jgi:hypothetical protein
MSNNEAKNADAKSDVQDNSNDKKSFFNKKENNGNVRTTKFEGRCKDLKNHVYDYGESKNADQFVTTTKEIKTYVGQTFKNAGDITAAITMLRMPTRKEPEDPEDPDNRVTLKKWERDYDEYRKWKLVLDENVKTLYNLVWGQCSEAMQQKVESIPSFDTMAAENDGITLLLAIKNTSYDYQSQIYRIEAVNNALYKLMVFRQGQHMNANQYFEQFTNLLSVYIHCGGSPLPDPGCSEDQKAQVREMSWANHFILHADRNRFGGLITDLQNQSVFKRSE